jgi:hypothetical protein
MVNHHVYPDLNHARARLVIRRRRTAPGTEEGSESNQQPLTSQTQGPFFASKQVLR